MIGAGEALQKAALASLGGVSGLGAFPLAPIQAGFPFATVDAGLEIDWSHKSGIGREVRLAVTIRDEGERPDRLQRLKREIEEALNGIGPPEGWKLISFAYLRSRVVRDGRGWVAVSEYRARMLAASGVVPAA